MHANPDLSPGVVGQMVVPGTPRDSLYILDTLLNLDAGRTGREAQTSDDCDFLQPYL